MKLHTSAPGRSVAHSGFNAGDEVPTQPQGFSDTLGPALQGEAKQDPVQKHLGDAKRISLIGLLMMVVGLAPILGWMALAPLSSAVVAQGYVKVDLNRRTLQHAEGGIVRAVLVRDGEEVKAGQPLIELGDVAVSANRQRLVYRMWSEKAGLQRLGAEQDRAALVKWPDALQAAARDDPDLADQMRKELSLFAARRDALNSQLGLMQSQKGKVAQEMQSLRAQISRVEESLVAQGKEYDSSVALTKEGFVPANRVAQLEAAMSDYRARIEERRGELVRAEQRLGDFDLKMRSLQDDYRQTASDGLKVARVRLQEIEQELAKAADASTRQVITAPVGGLVMGLRFTSTGGVIAPREPIADIVPANPRLLVEARIRTDDIARVHQGQTASLRFTAFKYRTTKPVPAKVTYLSPDRQVDQQTGAPYYTVQVEVTDPGLTGSIDPTQKLQAGMPADVYIEGGDRTPLQYLLEPITQVLLKAGRER